MKKYLLFLLFVVSANTFSQTNTDDLNIPINNNDVNDVKDRNLEQALKVVAPIDEIVNNLEASGNMPKEKTPMDFVEEDANKVKMTGFSDVKHEELSNETNISKNDEIINETSDYKEYNNHSSFGGKIFKIIGLIIFWFVAGFIINFFFYSGKPDYLVGKSQTAKTLHIILNIVTAIALLANIFA